MFTALNKQGKRVTIEDALKDEKYTCPSCNSELIQKRGSVNIHHFAHVVGGDCDNWSEMSEWHLKWQNNFDEQYREVSLGDHRADIKVSDYIIEFQHSPISEEELKQRIDFYTSYGKLIFLFDMRGKEIFSNRYVRNNFRWKYPSRTIIPPNNKDYFVFLQISDNTILFVKERLDNWSEFVVYKVITKLQFINLFKQINSIDILKQFCQNEIDIQADRDAHRAQIRLYEERIRELGEDIDSIKKDGHRELQKHKNSIDEYKVEVDRLKARESRQHRHIETLNEDIKKVRKGKIVEKIVEVEVPVVKEVKVEKIVGLNKKQVVEAITLELGRYISCAMTNENREKAYPRALFDKRILLVIDDSYNQKVS